MLEVKNLSYSFERPLFEDVNFTLQNRESLAILGVSGSGKSTLLNITSTLLKPQNGNVYLDGIDIYSKASKQNLLRHKIGIVFQSHYLFRGFSVRDNLKVSSLLSQKEIDFKLLQELQIDHILDQDVGSISGGQAQRVSIARMLTKRPSFIIADEPTGNLDKDTAIKTMQILLNYIDQNDAVLLLATHDRDIASLCTRTVALNDKRLNLI